MEAQRSITMERIQFLLRKGVFRGWLTNNDLQFAFSRSAVHQSLGTFDHSLGIKLGVHFHLWGGAVKYLGTERHYKKWLQATEDYVVKGCFVMTELGHGSNVRGIETITTYDASTQEFVVNTPCESAQKYWIGGAANSYHLAENLGHAFSERCVLETFLAVEEEQTHPSIKSLLGQMRALYVLSSIDENPVFFKVWIYNT
ncbi:hypothetical protein L7F22_032041 [Adiantum nelumboides]|nr:hypothetical protein [Adiantum nelumboides]